MKEINNDIEEDYCSFEIAKLLKEKGFACKVNYHYRDQELIYNGAFYNFNNPEEQKLWKIELLSAPTHQIALKWIRVNFNIDITICIVANSNYGHWIFKDRHRVYDEQGYYSSPQEATEAALLYVLMNLI